MNRIRSLTSLENLSQDLEDAQVNQIQDYTSE